MNTPFAKENLYAVNENNKDLAWNNQFAVYNVALNTWERCKTSGQIPTPRVGLASIVNRQDVYIFGGWHENGLLDDEEELSNDLSKLDLNKMSWSLIHSPSVGDVDNSIPKGINDF